ncbi:hypothetical protein [Bradyrhizobium sp. sGM-13]|uniref:hypothetical protein n=1 Tax=Bradyrhizobium sp. sGM-13 TaxID=2831781 RepID=UPI001BCF083C|nr:hypothetical protein [Bradyrhizobium sp. sGM-13]
MNDNDRREAVARLTTACEDLILRGVLSAVDELRLRQHTNAACVAFNMAPVQERESA